MDLILGYDLPLRGRGRRRGRAALDWRGRASRGLAEYTGTCMLSPGELNSKKGGKEEQHETGEEEPAADETITPVFVRNHQES
jgi:hypothetical protein